MLSIFSKLYVCGSACRIFNDPDMSKFLDSEFHLISWNGEESNRRMIDRYDVRNLLDDEQLFYTNASINKQKSIDIESMKLENECNLERYQDLDTLLNEPSLCDENEAIERVRLEHELLLDPGTNIEGKKTIKPFQSAYVNCRIRKEQNFLLAFDGFFLTYLWP